MSFFRTIREDLDRYANGGGLGRRIRIILISHSYHLVLTYRVGVALSRIPLVGAVFRIFFEYFIRLMYASDISLRSNIGPGLVIMHGHDIVIGSCVVIGKDCKILNGVTFGNKDTESEVNQQPVIGDRVIVGSGAKLLGAIVVGNDVIIGANSVVLTNFSNGVTIVGAPARVVGKQ